MDRQSLLEQKRQRLQELKQRRLGNTSHDDKLVNELIDQFQSSPIKPNTKQVNVAIQVDLAPQEHDVNYISNGIPIHHNESDANEKNVITYDKAIQTTDEPSDTEIENKTRIVDEPNESLETIENDSVVEIEESKLNASMKHTFKFLNKIITQEAIDSSILKNFSESEELKNEFDRSFDNQVSENGPFRLNLEIPVVKGRLIKYIDISPHFPELIVASYSLENSSINHLISNQLYLNGITQSPGLAIIYNIKGSKAFPEYFLHCTSSITEIKFDKVNPRKVIGGLSDGKVVIWNLLDNGRNSVAILPLLMTPVLSNIASSIINNDQQAVNFIHHTNEISSINQILVENNECIISTSLDGVINLWSSNLLAWPKISSLKLSKPSSNTEEYVKSKDILSISKALILQEETDLARSTKKELSSQPPAYKFLNKLLVGSDDGKLFRLSNDAGNGNIEQLYEEDNKDDENPLHSSSITSIMELPIDGGESIIATSNIDWTIKIWASAQKAPILQIPVTYLILDMEARPNYPLQFFTLGVFNQSMNHDLRPIIDFWDMSHKLMNPICSISLETKNEAGSDTVNSKLYATTARFDINGNNIIIGFNNGSILIWSIDDIILNEVLESKANSDIDDGLIEFLQRNKRM
jgi:dynein intermediate chain